MHAIARQFKRLRAVSVLVACISCDGTATRNLSASPDGGLFPPGVVPKGPEPVANVGPCALQINEVAAYQGVKVPLATVNASGWLMEPQLRNADLVAGRPALIRVFATPTEGWQGTATARLTLSSSQGTRIFDAASELPAASNDVAIASTFNFEVPGAALAADSSWRVDVISPSLCRAVPTVRFPREGMAALSPRATGILKVLIVPIHYDTDSSGRLPDLTEEQLQRYKNLLLSMYPVTGLELLVRDPVRTELGITSSKGWEDLLDSLRLLRQQDRAPADLHYYGMINPASTFSTYCGRGCTAGIAYVTKDRQAALRVGVGVGFPGQFAAQTLAHELGHQFGRLHAPCNVDGDSQFPYTRGGIGVWGYDASRKRMFDPEGYSDVMGYCSPLWISDYTYQGLLEHLAILQSTPTVQAATQALTVERTWNVLLVDGKGTPRWGHPIVTADDPSGTAEVAHVYGQDGLKVAEVTVYRHAIGDSETSFVWVPQAQSGWSSVKIRGAAPHSFTAPVATPALR